VISPRARHLVLVVAGAVLVGSGVALAQAAPRADVPDLGTAPAAAPSPVTGAPAPHAHVHEPAPIAPAPPPAPPPPLPAAAPVGVVLPGTAEPVPLVPVGALASGALQLPERPTVLGWFAPGAVPGDAAGSAVIAGHVDSARYGSGPLEQLYAVDLGQVVEVVDAAGERHRFAVTSRTSYRKTALPAEVFRTDGPPQLALITCGGAFDEVTGNYADNVVVLAQPVA
jgi:hypothetical protein